MRLPRRITSRGPRPEPLEPRVCLSFSPVGDAFSIGADTLHGSTPDVAIDGGGRMVGSWDFLLDTASIPTRDLFHPAVQRYDASGHPQGPLALPEGNQADLEVNGAIDYHGNFTAVDTDDAGNFVVAYVFNNDNPADAVVDFPTW